MTTTDLIARHATNLVADLLEESRAVALVGPRQSGKSTLARELLAERWPAAYLSLDDEDTRSAAMSDPRSFIARTEGRTIIDEVQRVPDLMLAIKSRLDSNREPGQFLLTGSANLTQIASVKDTLPGRVIYVDVWPLSQAEIEGRGVGLLDRLVRNDVPDVRGGAIGVAPYLDRFIPGGFPGAIRWPARRRDRFFDGYIDSIVERDIPGISALRSIDGPARVLRLLATRSAGLLNVASLAQDLKIDNKTVDHHLRILRDLMLIRIHAPWFTNLGSRQVKTPKVYLTDSGLMAATLGVDRAGLQRDSVLLGSFLETAVCMEIVRAAAVAETRVGIFHYRDKKQREVDIILERADGKVVAIEVKAGATPTATDFSTLRYLRDGLGDRFLAGFVLNCGAETLPFGDRLLAIPISVLWE